MRELRKKTKLILFLLLSTFLLTALIFLNVRIYSREKEDVRRNLNVLEERKEQQKTLGKPGQGDTDKTEKPEKTENTDKTGNSEKSEKDEPPGDAPEMNPRDMENMMTPDTELYTVEIKDGEVTEIFCSGTASEDFDVDSIAAEIINSDTKDGAHIGNLYFTEFSFKYRHNVSIVILNNKEIKQKLWEQILESLLIWIVMEIVIVFVTRLITGWITKPAEEAFLRQKEFIADASHELKTPLAVIMASADEIQGQDADKKHIENIRYESDRMSRLIAGLLKLSHLENGDDAEERTEENLSMILEKTCMSYEAVAFEEGVAIDTKIEEGLQYKCHKVEIEQMAATLLDNAVRHSYKDTTVRVEAARSKGKGGIVIKVINTGDPIPEEDREKIFERFYRGDKSRNREDNRYGLGLAIAKRIAQNHNGDIETYSEGKDTVFKVVMR